MAGVLSCGTMPEPSTSISICDPNTPTSGEVRLEPWCSDLEIVAREGRSRDWWLGNSQINAVIRYPTVSVTAAGVGGGSLVDLSLAGQNDLIHEIIHAFLDDVPNQINVLKKSLVEADAATARRHAHSIKGAAGTVGAVALQSVAFGIEQAAQDANLGSAYDLFPSLEKAFDDLATRLAREGLNRCAACK